MELTNRARDWTTLWWVFLWLLTNRYLSTHEKLQRKFQNWSISPSKSQLWLQEEKSNKHLFLHSPFAAKGRHTIFDVFGGGNWNSVLINKIDDWLMEKLNKRFFGGKKQVYWRDAALFLHWDLWKQRNSRVSKISFFFLGLLLLVKNNASWWSTN